MEEPKPYRFGRAATQSPALLNAVERLNERIARRVRAIVEPFSGGRPKVRPKAIEQTMFMMWDACVPAFASISLYRFHPVKGTVALRMDAPLISSLVDRFYGGAGGNPSVDAREFTPTETRLIDRISGQIMDALADCWAEIAPAEAYLIGRETGVGQAEICSGDADVAVQGFEIDIGDRESWTIDIVYPLDGLNAVEPVGGSRMVEEVRPIDPVWQQNLAERMDQVRLPAKSVLARPTLKMSELMALKPGDVINIHIARHLPLIVGNRLFAHGTIGEQDGRAAFMIEKLS